MSQALFLHASCRINILQSWIRFGRHATHPVRQLRVVAQAAREESTESLNVNADAFLGTFSAPVKRRVKKLKELQTEREDIDAEFRRASAELELKFEPRYANIYDARAAVIAGTAVVPEYDVLSEPDDLDEGIPKFWLQAMSNNETVAQAISDQDSAILQYLTDIRSQTLRNNGETTGFKLTFSFAENPYFPEKELSKTYILGDDVDMASRAADGSRISWYSGKNPTVKQVKKKTKGKGRKPVTATREEPTPSFFNFFNPPKLPEIEDEDDMDDDLIYEMQNDLDRDFEIGTAIKDMIIPDAVSWFTGEALDYLDEDAYIDDYEDYEDEEEEMEPEPEPKPPKKASKAKGKA